MPARSRMSFHEHRGAAPRAPEARAWDAPALGCDDVHVWVVRLDAPDRGGNRSSLLSAEELQRAGRYRSVLDSAAFMHRRAALRVILAGYLRLSPRNIAFSVNEFGKPSLIAAQAEGLFFNTSHSESLALIAVTRAGRIGIDIERLRPYAEEEAVARQFFSANERASLAALDPRDRLEAFFNAWTRKEAVVKALGSGLSIPLDSFDVSLRPGEPPAVLRWAIPNTAPGRLRIHHLEPAAGYIGALAVDGAASVCRWWRWAK